MKELEEFYKALKQIQVIEKQLPTIVGSTAIGFFKKRFVAQNWIGHTTKPWKSRRKNDKRKGRRAILVQSGRLKRGIRVTHKSSARVVIGNDVPYARIHNEGGHIKQTVQVRAHKRNRKRTATREVTSLKTKKTSRRKVTDVTTGKVKAHKRNMNTRIPQRQFMGDSPQLAKEIERQVLVKIKKAFK